MISAVVNVTCPYGVCGGTGWDTRAPRAVRCACKLPPPAPTPLFLPDAPLELDAEDRAQVVGPEDGAPRRGTIAERASAFHARNPHVYRLAAKVARYMRARGVRRYGIGAVWEVMRFKYLETVGEVYRLNNNHRSFYARLLMRQEADLAGFFSTRDAQEDRHVPE